LQDITFAFSEFWRGLRSVIASGSPIDLLDILVVAYLLYHAIRLVRDTRALQLVKGIAIVLIVYLAAVSLNMLTLAFIIQNIMQWGILAIAILFQPELRRALEHVGRSKFNIGIGRLGTREGEERPVIMQNLIETVCQSAEFLSDSKTGALMVIERETKLGDVIPSGTIIDSAPSVSLVRNIFYPKTPLHDGAMIFREGRVHAAGCFLPLSDNDGIGRELGTRHRAALGMSEVSDAIVVVVSEETGKISVAMDGKLSRDFTRQNLRALLIEKLLGPGPEEPKKTFWRKSQ